MYRVMQINWLPAVCFGLLVWLNPAFAEPVEEPAPIAIISETGHDFGTVLEGTVVTHDFSIKNAGNATLTVIDVKAG